MSRNVKVPMGNAEARVPRCVKVFAQGIRNSHDFIRGFSLLLGDLATEALPAGTGNAMANAGGKLLKCVDLEQRYGRISASSATRKLLEFEMELGDGDE